MANLLTKIFIAGSILALVAIFALVGMRKPKEPVVEIPSYSPPTVMAEPLETVTVDSPDGKMSLTMKTEKGQETDVYTFSAAGKDNALKEIYKRSVPVGTVVSIPFNTFSPDNKYLLLKEEALGQASHFVLKTSGESFDQDLEVAEVTAPFLAKYEKYDIRDVTGWGGLNLVVINTDKKSGGTGPSFWFDVSSRSFIQLSSRF